LISALLSTLAANAVNIRDVDFNNFSYPWDDESFPSVPQDWRWIMHTPDTKVTLTQGRGDFQPPGEKESSGSHNSHPYLMFRSVTYGDVNGDGLEDAAVDLLYGTGGKANWHYLYLFTPHQDGPKLLARLESGSRTDGGLINVSIEEGLLILDFMDGNMRSGDCCSEGYIRARYRWEQGRFAEQGPRTYGPLEIIEQPMEE
jgi:hypothetical protein